MCFYFRDFKRQIPNKGIKFRVLSVLNFILWNFFIFPDKLKQVDEDER